MFLKNLSSSVLLICEEQGLTYERASELCEISSRQFGNIARGKSAPSVLTLEKLCRGLDTTPNELLLLPADFYQRSFRQPLAVLRSSQGGPACPRCGSPLEHEQQNFCDRCGQKLDWLDVPPQK